MMTPEQNPQMAKVCEIFETILHALVQMDLANSTSA